MRRAILVERHGSKKAALDVRGELLECIEMLRHKARARIFPMKERACRAILGAIIRIGESAPAIRAEGIERAIAEQAIELIRVDALMAWKVWARAMREERIVVSLLRFHAHKYSNAAG